MDANLFDTWTRTIAAPESRRTLLRVFAGATALGWHYRADNVAACRNSGRKCKKGAQCCSGKCKRKKCRAVPPPPGPPPPTCTPLTASCQAGDACCAKDGASVGCVFQDNGFKPQCGANGYRCLLSANDPCADDCECGANFACGGTPTTRCCLAIGRPCTPGPDDGLCCSERCGCIAPGSCSCRFANCKNPGSSCVLHTQCCTGVCSSGACCLPQGIACTNTSQCCGGLACDGGFCDTL
jgi:hypothetical protein